MGPGVVAPRDYNQRALKPLGGGHIPGAWCILDTETRPATSGGVTSHYFHIGWTCLWTIPKGKRRGRQEWVYHDDRDAFNDYLLGLCTRFKGLILLGHNIFFDLQAAGSYRVFTRAGWVLDFYYDRGVTYILKCKKQRSTVTVISSTNWFDQSLKKLGKTLKLPKLDVDFESADPETLKRYCRRDVEIVVKALKKYMQFIRAHDLGGLALTKASQAFRAYRHRFMARKILIHSQEHIHDLERAAYLGGRTECFFVGQCSGGPFVSLDINSMYPYVMKKYRYPQRLLAYYESPDPGVIRDRLERRGVIAEVVLKTPEPVYAVKVRGKTLFPTGVFTAFLCSEGLRYALSAGHVREVVRASVYVMADLFTPYVDYFYPLRLKYGAEGNDIFELLCKYMGNALYGKFGQLDIHTDLADLFTGDEYSREDVPNLATGRTVVITRFMNKLLTQWPEGEAENSSVCIAAHITENARLELWNLIKQVGRKRVLYCDTDSIKIRVRDLKHVSRKIDPFELGALKEEDRSDHLYLEGPKNYRTEDVRKIKGIPHRAVEVTPGVFTFETFARQVTHMRASQIEGARLIKVRRELKAPYTKGRVSSSGRVTPFRFPVDLPPSSRPRRSS